MKRNVFGKAYCTTIGELIAELDKHDLETSDVYLQVDPPEGEWSATAEILEYVEGTTVCHIEAPTEAAVRALAAKLGIE